MHEILQLILGYVRGTWRYRWWMLGISWVVAAGGWVYVASLPDQYRASARVYVDTQNLLKPLLGRSIVSTGEGRRLALMTKTLFSRPNLEKLMRMTDLDLQAKTKQDTEELLSRILKNIGLSGTQNFNLYTLSYLDENPELAKQMVKSLLTIFVESSLGGSRKDQDSTRQFLEQQIAEYESRLMEAEQRQENFRRTNMQYLQEGGGYYSQLRQNQVLLTQAKLDLQIQEDRLQAMQEQMEDAEDDEFIDDELLLLSSDQGATEYTARIAAQQARLDELLLRFTEKHPDVIGSRRTIQGLKAKHQKALKEKQASHSGPGADNPVYQQLRLTYADAKAEVAAKGAVVKEYEKRIARLEEALEKALQVEKQQKQMNRDYGLLQSQHQKFLSSLESMRLTQDVGNRAGAVRFRIIDPPIVPSKPSGPPRMLFSSAVLVVGLGFGVAVAFLLSQVRPTFDDRKTLNELTDLPVLGSVSMIWTQQQQNIRRRRHLGFMTGLLALVSAYGVVAAAYILEVSWVYQLGKLRSIAGI